MFNKCTETHTQAVRLLDPNVSSLGAKLSPILRCFSRRTVVSLLFPAPPLGLWTSATLVKWEPPHLHFLGDLAADPFILPQQDPGDCTETLGCSRHASLFCLQEQHPQRSSFKGCHPQICLSGIRNFIFLCIWDLDLQHLRWMQVDATKLKHLELQGNTGSVFLV